MHTDPIIPFVRLPVVGSCIVYMNTEDISDEHNGWAGKIIGELRYGTVHTLSVRWFTGNVDHDIKPEHCAHV